jgi:hypothetical protein
MASVKQVSANWPNYADQVPRGYNKMYDYTGVRYTNWSKIPVLMPAVKEVLSWGLADVETLSVRSYVLNLYRTYMYLLLVLEVLLIAGTIFCFWDQLRGGGWSTQND